MAISILNYYEQPDGKNLMIMADDLYERNPGEAPDDNMPMDPTNYAISQNLGIPADGSITIVRDFDEDKKVKTVTNVFKEGEWKDAAEGGGSGERSLAAQIVDRSVTNVTARDLNGITKIGSYAFGNCSSLTDISIPEGVTRIGERAFYNCSDLSNIIIPNSVTHIDWYAFYKCTSLLNITIPDSVTLIDQHAFESSGLIEITIGNGPITIGQYSFSGCNSLTKVTILDNVIDIADSAFYNCRRLTSVTLPNNLKIINNSLFAQCQSLPNITIPDSVTDIKENAFGNCWALETVVMGNSLTNIGSRAFVGCIKLSSVKMLPMTPPTLGSNAFYDASVDLKIIVPKGTLNAYKSAANWSVYADKIVEADE